MSSLKDSLTEIQLNLELKISYEIYLLYIYFVYFSCFELCTYCNDQHKVI